jgi:hypothetical protein
MGLACTETVVRSWNDLVAELHSREIVPVREDEGGHLRSHYVFRGTDNAGWPLETSLTRLRGFIPDNSRISSAQADIVAGGTGGRVPARLPG